MNKKQITFQVDERKFTTKLISDTKAQNKIYYYMISESKDVINLTFIEDDIIEALKNNDESHLIMIESKKNSISLDEKTKLIPS